MASGSLVAAASAQMGSTMENTDSQAEATRKAATLELRNVSKSYGNVQAVDDISLSLAKGEFLTLLGPSGCGKTTLLNMIAGFFPPTTGSIVIQGKDVTRLMPHQRRTGIMFQNYALFPHMSVAQNIAFGLEERKVTKAEIRERVARIMAMVNLPGFEDRKPSQLSGGQQQRVALARALVIEPEVLLLDEPFSALDKSLRTKMQLEIKQIQQQAQVATVFVTHDQSEALSMSDRIAVMSKGQIEQIGAPRDIYRHPQSRFVASFVGEINRIPVKVARTTSDGIELLGPAGLSLTFPKRIDGTSDGMDAELYVRPEDIQVVSRPAAGVNALKAGVLACSYQGSFTHVVLGAEGMENLLIAAPASSTTDALAPGHQINLHFDLDRATLLPA